MAQYLYQTVETVTSPDDDSVIVSVRAAGSLVGSTVTVRKPKLGKVAPVISTEDRKPFRFTADGASAIARYRCDSPAVLTAWASTPDASERLALLQSTGVEPVYGTSPLSPTNAALALMRSVGRETFAAMLASGGFAVETARGSKAAATAGANRAATASERTAAVLDSMFADADTSETVEPSKGKGGKSA